jgi:SAM-dependent methyltransferase
MVDGGTLRGVREAYDAVAEEYARRFGDTLRDRPLERAMPGAFAKAVRAGGDGEVADVGCGPGHITAYLRGLGLRVFGVDASSAMLALAREANPGVRFDEGSMAALDVADGTLGGVLSRASIVHTPPEEVPAIVREFRCVLAPGGHLLVSVAATDDPSVPTQAFDHKVATAYRWSPDHLAALLRASGLLETARLVREPRPTDRRQFQEVHLLARKDEPPSAATADPSSYGTRPSGLYGTRPSGLYGTRPSGFTTAEAALRRRSS